MYIMNYIDRTMWTPALGTWPESWDEDAMVVGRLGVALSRCIVGPGSSEVVNSYIIPSVIHSFISPFFSLVPKQPLTMV